MEAIDAPQTEAAADTDVPAVPPAAADPNDMGTSTAGPVHRGMYKGDKRRQKYRVDQWCVRVASQNDPNRLSRPEGVSEAEWRKANTEQRKRYLTMFEPRVQGIEPDGESAKVVRRRALEEQRAAKRSKRDDHALAVMIGFNSLRTRAEDLCDSGASS